MVEHIVLENLAGVLDDYLMEYIFSDGDLNQNKLDNIHGRLYPLAIMSVAKSEFYAALNAVRYVIPELKNIFKYDVFEAGIKGADGEGTYVEILNCLEKCVEDYEKDVEKEEK